MILTPGQRDDAPIAPDLPNGLSPERVPADKAYESNALRGSIARMQAEPVIRCGFEACKVRNTVEVCFNKLKPFRRIATRFDRRAVYLLSFTPRISNALDAMNVDPT